MILTIGMTHNDWLNGILQGSRNFTHGFVSG
jgi:hypothetical protein